MGEIDTNRLMEIAADYFNDFTATESDEDFKMAVMTSLAAIGQALLDIRDELRKEKE